jgi:hypothetical protein
LVLTLIIDKTEKTSAFNRRRNYECGKFECGQ